VDSPFNQALPLFGDKSIEFRTRVFQSLQQQMNYATQLAIFNAIPAANFNADGSHQSHTRSGPIWKNHLDKQQSAINPIRLKFNF